MSLSLPSRGAWIEISFLRLDISGLQVAPLAGSVDRNLSERKCADHRGGRSPRGERG